MTTDHITTRRARQVRLGNEHRDLAAKLRASRLCAGINGRTLAKRHGWAESRVTKIEQAEQFPTDADLTAYITALEMPAEDAVQVREEWAGLCREIRKRELLARGLAGLQDDTAAEEALATGIRIYSSSVIPGLVQTPGYARALYTIINAFHDRDDDIETAVAARMKRQQVLYRGIPVTLLIAESVLRTALAATDVMADQADKIRGLIGDEVPGLSIGIIPLDAPHPAVPTHAYWIEDYADQVEVSIELVGSEITQRDPWQVGKYRQHFADLERVASFGAGARALLAVVADRYRSSQHCSRCEPSS
jgi:transcriptional regulator with XRE-family HTH domain